MIKIAVPILPARPPRARVIAAIIKLTPKMQNPRGPLGRRGLAETIEMRSVSCWR
jgi:hypothetical protein